MIDHRKLIAEKADKNNEIQLWEHSYHGINEYEMIINGVFIMATYNSLSSELLVQNVLNDINSDKKRILIGGLGFGFSVKEACKCEKKISEIYVVETNPVVIEWNKTYLHNLNGKYLSDKRVNLVQDDFIRFTMNTDILFDAICMDIDNGPMLLISPNNKTAYTIDFFIRVKNILRKDGIFSVWSGNKDQQLSGDMLEAFGNCNVEEVIEQHFGKNVSYYLYSSKNII